MDAKGSERDGEIVQRAASYNLTVYLTASSSSIFFPTPYGILICLKKSMEIVYRYLFHRYLDRWGSHRVQSRPLWEGLTSMQVLHIDTDFNLLHRIVQVGLFLRPGSRLGCQRLKSVSM
jgi:hypothetical protein